MAKLDQVPPEEVKYPGWTDTKIPEDTECQDTLGMVGGALHSVRPTGQGDRRASGRPPVLHVQRMRLAQRREPGREVHPGRTQPSRGRPLTKRSFGGMVR